MRTGATSFEPLEPRRLLASAVALDAANRLLFFDTDAPDRITQTLPVSGLAAGESLLAIDYRPANGVFYALGSGGRLHYINRISGVATQIGAGFIRALAGDSFDLDFDPVAERARVVSNADLNWRVNPDTGAIVDANPAAAGLQPDAPLAFAAGDVNAGADPVVVAAAYDNNVFGGGAAPTLYALDSAANALLRVGSAGGVPVSPTVGQLFTVGPLGVDIGKRSSLDILTVGGGADTAFAVLTVVGQLEPQLYTIDLTTGAATPVGSMGARATIDMTLAPPPPLAIALTPQNELLAFFMNEPTRILRRTPIRGLAAGESVVGIDVRPATGELLGLTTVGRLITINPRLGRTVTIGPAVALSGRPAGFGLDIDPVADRVRVTSNADSNLRLDPGTGAATADTALAYHAADANAGADPVITAAAYAGNDADPATPTTLYGIDTNLDVLVRHDPASGGVLHTVGSLGRDIVTGTGFDVLTTDGFDEAYAVLQVDGQTRAALYRINLATGLAMRIGEVAGNRPLVGLAMLPAV